MMKPRKAGALSRHDELGAANGLRLSGNHDVSTGLVSGPQVADSFVNQTVSLTLKLTQRPYHFKTCSWDGGDSVTLRRSQSQRTSWSSALPTTRSKGSLIASPVTLPSSLLG
ncbi:unnamed protein product [Phytophthora lilii]|uniref:Unnamed protein product n=1 Tax=Phytophthora lilii TaxID=2077276 RepID=A0A9W6X2C0_9STRA|nr:unnamed protein product [Phytophthora lilii]